MLELSGSQDQAKCRHLFRAIVNPQARKVWLSMTNPCDIPKHTTVGQEMSFEMEFQKSGPGAQNSVSNKGRIVIPGIL